MLISVLLVSLFLYEGQSQQTCKAPYVEHRLLADDVRYASPFYVVALPKTPETLEMDNICYTYFEQSAGFFHIMSVTYKNGTNTYYRFSKGDITDRIGIAEAVAQQDECIYHDYTLRPICNNTVFILYRCFISGQCRGNIDQGPIPGVDVRVTLAASPKIDSVCQAETQSSLRNTSELDGGDYILLPQKMTPTCITKFNDQISIGENRALGPKTITEPAKPANDLSERFGLDATPKPVATPTNQGAWSQANLKGGVPPPSAMNPYGHPSNGVNAPYPAPSNPASNGYAGFGGYTSSGSSASYGAPQSPMRPGQSPSYTWPPPNNVQRHPSQWNAQTVHPGAETHYHIWQSGATAAALKSITDKNPNVYYHVHSWEHPPNCCKCL